MIGLNIMVDIMVYNNHMYVDLNFWNHKQILAIMYSLWIEC